MFSCTLIENILLDFSFSWLRQFMPFIFIFLILIQGYVSLILEREKGGEWEWWARERGETSMLPVGIGTLTRYWTRNLGMCPDWGSNPQTFSCSGTMLQPTEPPGQGYLVFLRSQFRSLGGQLSFYLKLLLFLFLRHNFEGYIILGWEFIFCLHSEDILHMKSAAILLTLLWR